MSETYLIDKRYIQFRVTETRFVKPDISTRRFLRANRAAMRKNRKYQQGKMFLYPPYYVRDYGRLFVTAGELKR